MYIHTDKLMMMYLNVPHTVSSRYIDLILLILEWMTYTECLVRSRLCKQIRKYLYYYNYNYINVKLNY